MPPADLGGRNDDVAILGRAQVAEDAHERGGLGAGFLRLRHVHVHLVAVEIGVVRRAHALVEAERPACTDMRCGVSTLSMGLIQVG